jgi:hypothetical protein
MEQSSIFLPFLTQAALTVAILFWLAWSRVSRISKHGMAAIVKTGFPKHVDNASNNLKNQFELPVIFYAICLFFFVTDGVNQVVMIVAWVFVAARVAHALVHLTKNVIFPYRFLAFLISALSLTTMIVFAFLHLSTL